METLTRNGYTRTMQRNDRNGNNRRHSNGYNNRYSGDGYDNGEMSARNYWPPRDWRSFTEIKFNRKTTQSSLSCIIITGGWMPRR